MTLGNGERETVLEDVSVFVAVVEADVDPETDGEPDPPPFNNTSIVVAETKGDAVVE